MPTRDSLPIVYGEVLFDQFADGGRILGGAPFNVAWHLQGFGLHPLLISRIGQDPLGDEILMAMKDWGMNTQGVQRDQSRATGTVAVTMINGEPAYDIVADVAYDHIFEATARQILSDFQPSMLYHGTLAIRTQGAQYTLQSLRESLHDSMGIPIFVDINLRPPWWTRERNEILIKGINWLKLNQDELQQLCDRPLMPLEYPEAARELIRNHDIDSVILTIGQEGAMAISASEQHSAHPAWVQDVVDTVGAGDAFSAVVMLGISRGWGQLLILQRATSFAAAICQQRGATAADVELYRRFMQEWGL